jgi:repressor LexA
MSSVKPSIAFSGLTRQQLRALEYIKQYYKLAGVCPTFDEIAKALDLKSKSNVHRIVHGLRERGVISLLPNRRRSIHIISTIRCPSCGDLIKL